MSSGGNNPDQTGGEYSKVVLNDALVEAAERGRLKVCGRLIRAGADVNAVRRESRSKHTALFTAVFYGRPRVAKLLVEAGADIHRTEVGAKGRSLLHLAAGLGKEKTCKIMVEAGISVEARDDEGRNPLHMTTCLGGERAAKFLISSGANPNSTANNGRTPQFRAAASGCIEVCRLLIANGADLAYAVRTSLPRAATPMEAAVMQDRVDVVRYFHEECGIAVDVPVNDGCCLMDLASAGSAVRAYLLALRTQQAVEESVNEALLT